MKWPWRRRRRDHAGPSRGVLAAAAGRTWPSWLHVDESGDVRTDAITWRRTGSFGPQPPASVDPAGAVVAYPGAPLLEWWVRGADGWVRPDTVDGCSQADVAGTPVWETAIPFAGPREGPGAGTIGRVAARVYGVGGTPSRIVIAVGNDSGAPVAVAFVSRPCSAEGARAVHDIDVDDATVVVDGRAFLQLLNGTPHRFVTATAADGDAGDMIDSPQRHLDPGVHDPDGLATFAVVYPLEHGSVLHVALPLSGGESRGDAAGATSVPPVTAVERSDAVVRGWKRQTQQAAQWSLADGAAERFMARRAGDALLALDVCDGVERVIVARALLALGCADQVAAWWAGRCADDRADPAALVIAGDLWRMTRDRSHVRDRLSVIEQTAFAAAAAHGADAPLAHEAVIAAASLAAAVDADELEASLQGVGRAFVADGVGRLQIALPTVDDAVAAIADGTAEADPVAAARIALVLCRAVARDDDDELVLFDGLPEQWRGQDLAVSGLPTRFGRVDLRHTCESDTSVLQWRGLWGAVEPVLRAPSLAADWSTVDAAGIVTFAAC